MGQYYNIVNVDKKEYLCPHDFGAGLKLMEFADPLYPSRILSGLAILLADGNNRGGGDLLSDNFIIGRWKYDRIVVLGDYADENDLVDYTNVEMPEWKNVGISVWVAMSDNFSFANRYGEILEGGYDTHGVFPESLVAMAHAHKDKQYSDNKYPILAVNAEHFFENLFPDVDTSYYKTINGIAKHHSITYADLRKLETNQALLEHEIKQNYRGLVKESEERARKEWAQFKKTMDELFGES